MTTARINTIALDVYGGAAISEPERLAISRVRRRMDRLGSEIITITCEPEPAGRWHVQWRVKDRALRNLSYGASGATALAAAHAALANAHSALT